MEDGTLICSGVGNFVGWTKGSSSLDIGKAGKIPYPAGASECVVSPQTAGHFYARRLSEKVVRPPFFLWCDTFNCVYCVRLGPLKGDARSLSSSGRFVLEMHALGETLPGLVKTLICMQFPSDGESFSGCFGRPPQTDCI